MGPMPWHHPPALRDPDETTPLKKKGLEQQLTGGASMCAHHGWQVAIVRKEEHVRDVPRVINQQLTV